MGLGNRLGHEINFYFTALKERLFKKNWLFIEIEHNE